MNNIILHKTPQDIITEQEVWKAFTAAADEASKISVFETYCNHISDGTKRAHVSDMGLFVDFLDQFGGWKLPAKPISHLAACNCTACDNHRKTRAKRIEAFRSDGSIWAERQMTYGVVQQFVDYLYRDGYAISSINRRLSTVKIYAKLAHKAGSISQQEHLMIRGVEAVAQNIIVDENRTAAGLETRKSSKKEEPTEISLSKVHDLKNDHDLETPQGIRDALMMCLLLDTGIRCSDLAALKVKDIVQWGETPETTELYWIPKKTRRFETEVSQFTTPDLYKMLKLYIASGHIPGDEEDFLLRSSHRSGSLTTPGMSTRAIYSRIREIGKHCGIEKLSPHDCRHNWAQRYADKEPSVVEIAKAGGWRGLEMAQHYATNRNRTARYHGQI
jgi:integrase